MRKVNILGVNIDAITLDDMLGFIGEVVQRKQRARIAHVNIRGINLAYEHEWYRSCLNNMNMVYCDGMGVMLGARLLGSSLPQRYTLADWVWLLAQQSAYRSDNIFLLGNTPGVASKAAVCLKTNIPGLPTVLSHHGFFNKQRDCNENQTVVNLINQANVNVLLIGMGMPQQEKWLSENWNDLDVNVAITCGALFEYITGDLKRGPAWLTQNYLEWFARVLISPQRYTMRYMVDIPKFFFRILLYRFKRHRFNS